MKTRNLLLFSFFAACHSASAVTLIQDNFGRTGALNGSMPDVSYGGGSWIGGDFSSNGSVLTKSASGTLGAGVSIGGTLGSGIYDLSARISFAANEAPGSTVWGIGFSNLQTTGSKLTDTNGGGGSPWIFLRENGAVEFRPLPINNSAGQSITVSNAGTFPPGGSYTLRLSIDTTGPLWVVSGFMNSGAGEIQLDLDPNSAGLTHSYTGSNPDIRYAGITSTSTLGTLDEFLLSGPIPIPEPSALVLGATGVFGLLALRRRRA